MVFLFLAAGFSFAEAPVETGTAPVTLVAGKDLDKILKEFFEFAGKSKKKDPAVEALLKNFQNKVEDKKILLKIGSTEESVFPALDAGTLENEVLIISLNEYLLLNYETSPSILYSSLVFLAEYFKDNTGSGERELLNETERRIKSCDLQARFADNYLSKSKLKLTPYEKALLASYRDNNLYDFMFKYYAIDAEWLDYLKEVFSSESTVKGKLKQLRDIGEKKIVETKVKLKEGAAEEDIYNALVMPNMYSELVPYYVYELSSGKKAGNIPEDFYWTAQDPKLAQTMLKLREIITPYLGGLEYKNKLRENIAKILVQK